MRIVVFALLALVTFPSKPSSAGVVALPRRALIRAAYCLVKKHPDGVVEAPATMPGSADETAMLDAMKPALTECLTAARLNDDAGTRFELLAAIAERRRDRVLDIKGYDQKTMDATGYSDNFMRRTVGWPRDVAVATCAFLRDPRAKERLLATLPGRSAEVGALKQVAAVASSCVPAGEQFRMSGVRLRGLIARANYAEAFQSYLSPAP